MNAVKINVMNEISIRDEDASGGEPGIGVDATLGLLNVIGAEEAMTQRGLAVRLGVALGLANALVKRCVKKGLVKVKQVPARRYAYYLTPEGFREKSRLVGQYLSHSLNFYRRARGEYAETLAYCERRGWTKVALFGASELAEIATLAAHEAGVHLVGVVDAKRNVERFGGLRVVCGLDELGGVDAVIVTDSVEPQRCYDLLSLVLPPERVLTPKLLHVSRHGAADAGEQAA